MLRRADLRWVIVSFNGLLFSSLYFFSNLEIRVSNEVVSTFIFIIFIFSIPERIRTFDRLLRRQILYPAELRVLVVVPQGFEPRLFWTKTRRVANYTIGQNVEEEGFEPPVPCGTLVFKTSAFDHSATPLIILEPLARFELTTC